MRISFLKFKTILILLSVSVLLVSCSNDDDGPKESAGTQELLLGKWLVTESSAQAELSDCEKTSFINYLNNGTAQSILYIDNADGECYPMLGGELNYELVSETKIKFTPEEGDSFICDIISISPTNMKLKGFLDADGILSFKK